MAKRVRRGVLFGGAATGIFVFGIVMAILGTLFGLLEVRERLNLSFEQQGTVILLLYAGIFLATVIAGPVIDSIGNKVILVVSSVLVAGAMAGFVYAHSFVGAAVPAVMVGLGGGGLNISTNALVSDVYGEERGPMLNVLGIFYGIGALCSPLLATVVTEHFTSGQWLWICAGLAGACAVLFVGLKFPAARAAQSFSWREALQVARYPGVLVIGFLLFCQSGNEASIAGWTSTYVHAEGTPEHGAAVVLAVYWTALVMGRLAVSQLLRVVGKEELVLASGMGAVVGTGMLLASRTEAMLGTGAALIGLSYAGIFPTTLAIAGDRYQKMAGTVFGLVFAIALVGGMIFPWAVGQISHWLGVRIGMVVPLAGAAGIVGLAWRMRRGDRKANG